MGKDAIACIPQDAAVETGEALRAHLLLELAQLVELAFRAELSGDEFGRPRPHAVCDVVAGNHEVLSAIILSAHHDMAMRMTGIEVICGDPVQPRAEIGFHLPHQIAHERTQHPYSWWLHFFLRDRAIAADYVKSYAVKVKDIMTRDVKMAAPDTPLHEIADLLEENHIKRVPIVSKGGDLVGIVSRADIIQAVASVRPKLELSLPDGEIRERLMNELKQQPWAHIHKLNATVTNGEVDLWGLVQSDTERRAVTVAAEAIPGVTAVNDHLKLESASVY
jgi:hypothetical protein